MRSPLLAEMLGRVIFMAKSLHTCRFIRLPGGCYVEGSSMNNAFLWKSSIGPVEQRVGHWNGFWRYWSTDGEQMALHIACMQHCHIVCLCNRIHITMQAKPDMTASMTQANMLCRAWHT